MILSLSLGDNVTGELSRNKRFGIARVARSVSESRVQKRKLRGEFRGVSLKRFVQSWKHLGYGGAHSRDCKSTSWAGALSSSLQWVVFCAVIFFRALPVTL